MSISPDMSVEGADDYVTESKFKEYVPKMMPKVNMDLMQLMPNKEANRSYTRIMHKNKNA